MRGLPALGSPTGFATDRGGRLNNLNSPMHSDLIARINTDHLVHNCRVIRGLCRPGTRICAVLKADAYGHGLSLVAPVLQEAGVEFAAVATLLEAVELRTVGWRRPILVLGNVLAVTDPRERRERLRAIIRHQLTLSITDYEAIKTLSRMDVRSPVEVHIKVDTGMGRMGVLPDQALFLVQAVLASPKLRLSGIYSHFATADFELRDLVDHQLATFNATLSRLAPLLPPNLARHLANTAATLTLPAAHFDMVRPGLAMYGLVPAEHLGANLTLKPVLRLVSHLTAVKDLPAGHCVGYGQAFTTRRPTRLGIVPIGYYDGYVRSLSNRAVVGTPDGDAPVIGRVSMDQMAVDLTDLPPQRLGTEIVIIDDRVDRPNSVPALARLMNTIPYEVLCLLGQRIQRIAVGSSCGATAPPLDPRQKQALLAATD